MTIDRTGAPRQGRPFYLLIAVGIAAVAGVTVGTVTGTPAPTPVPTAPVAALPTSTPDLRPTLPPRTLTPTQPPVIVQTSPAPSVVPTTAPTAPPTSTPRPAPTPEPRGRAVVYFASHQGVPVAVEEPKAAGGQSTSDHVYFRMAALRTTKVQVPSGYTNLFTTMQAAFVETTVTEPGTVAVGFVVGVDRGDWGVPAEDVKLLLQQIVYTATEEPGIERVLITQNGGKPAVIAGRTFDKPLGRAEVR